MSRSDYHERKEDKIKRYEERAEKAERNSENAWKASCDATSGIPLGQPILVGHHSEKRHRNALARAHRQMDKMVEEGEKAKYWKEKVASAKSDTAISSDNPDAIDELREKLGKLQKKHSQLKEIRADFRRWLKNKKIEITEKRREIFEKAVELNVVPVESYELQYLNREMKRLKDRIETLETLSKMKTETWKIGPVEICANVEENRVQIFFPGKPDEPVRNDLKRNGFRWSPKAGAWQRQLTKWAVRLAMEIVTEHYGDKAAG